MRKKHLVMAQHSYCNTTREDRTSFHDEEERQDHEKSGPAIGIDLGTTYCCMAVLRDIKGTPEAIPGYTGDSKTPSYISFRPNNDEDDEDEEEINFGEFAKNLAHENPKWTIFDLKRMLGRKFHDPIIQHDRQFWPFDIIEEHGEIKVMTGPNTSKYPSEIMAEFIKFLKQAADDHLGYRVDCAVVTVPVYFNQHQRELTTQACEQAGLRVLQFISEPTAAAVAYSIPKISQNAAISKNCLVFDLGGGTFDLAYLHITGGQVHVKAIGGDDHLGGQDIDNNLVDYCIKQFFKTHGINLLNADNKKKVTNLVESTKISTRLRRLRFECEKQKRMLSQGKRISINLDKIYKDKDLSVAVTREVFDDINKELFERCLQVLQRFLKSHQISKEVIDDVVIVGGSSKIPRIQRMLSDFFGGKPLSKGVDPDKAVALGASSLAFFAENGEVPNVLLQGHVSPSPPTYANDETQIQGIMSSLNVRQNPEIPAVPQGQGPVEGQFKTNSVKQKASMFQKKSPNAVPIRFERDNAQGQALAQHRQKFQTEPLLQNSDFSPINDKKSLQRPSEDGYMVPIQVQSVIPSSFAEVKKPDIGIYISCNTFQIGSCKEPTAQSFTELITITPELYFGDKEILIGAKAHAFIDAIHSPMNEKYFDIFELINSPEIKTHQLNIQGNTFTLCTAHVIAAFFLQVFKLLNICGDGKIIVTLPLNKTYSGVEKIRKSLNILGYFNVRILPSLLTTAIGSFGTLGYYKRLDIEPSFRRYVFVLDIQMDSFSVAIIQMLPRGISAVSSSRSEGVAECQHKSFAQYHANWYKGIQISQEGKNYIQSAYEQVIDSFLAIPLIGAISKIEAAIINEPKGSSSFVNMVKEVLRAKFYNLEIPQIEASPLLGASLLVSPPLRGVLTRAVQILDPNMLVDVKGLYSKSLVLTTNIEGKVVKIENFKSHQFKISSSKSKKKKEPYILLEETSNKIGGGKAPDAGYYECRVEGKRRRRFFQFSRPTISFEINCKEDLEGFFSLSVVKKSDPNFEILLTKKENIICGSVCVSPAASQFGKIIALYESQASSNSRMF